MDTIETIFLGSEDIDPTLYKGMPDAIDAAITSVLNLGNETACPSKITVNVQQSKVGVTHAWSNTILWMCPLSHISVYGQGSTQETKHCFAILQSRKTSKTHTTCRVFAESNDREAFVQLRRFDTLVKQQAVQRQALSSEKPTAQPEPETSSQQIKNVVRRQKNAAGLSDRPERPTSMLLMRSSNGLVRGQSSENLASTTAALSSQPTSTPLSKMRSLSLSRSSADAQSLKICIGAGRGIVPRGNMSGKSEIGFANLHIRLYGLQKEKLGMTHLVRTDRNGYALWNWRSSIELPEEVTLLPRPYLVLELWGKETGQSDALLGVARLLVADQTQGFAHSGSWIAMHRGSSLWASIQVHLGWEFPKSKLLMAPLPMIREAFPALSLSSLYTQIRQDKRRYDQMLMTVTAGMSSQQATRRSTPHAGGDGADMVMSFPPLCEPALIMLPSVSVDGAPGVLALTPYRIIFMPMFPIILSRFLQIWDECEGRYPSHLSVKRMLVDEFGELWYSKYKSEIREALERISKVVDVHGRRAGMFQQTACDHEYCQYECYWKKYTPMSIALGGVSKLELSKVDLEKKEEKSKSEQGIIANANVQVKVATMTLHCKACRTIKLDIFGGGLKKYAYPRSFSDEISPRKALDLARLFQEETRWLTIEGNFATSIVYHSSCVATDSESAPTPQKKTVNLKAKPKENTESGCKCHSDVHFGKVFFNFLSESGNGKESLIDETAEPAMAPLFPEWQSNDDAMHCVYCSEPFTFIRRRHHCRQCGIVVCDHCSHYKLPIPNHPNQSKVRTCVGCYHSLSQSDSNNPGERYDIDKVKLLKLAQQAWEVEKNRFREIATKSSAGNKLRRMPWWSVNAEYARIKTTWQRNWTVDIFNKGFTVCDSYPEMFGLPTVFAKKNINNLAAVAKFRSKGRIPILSWIHPKSTAPLCRCSQPMTGLTGHCSEDDVALINAIRFTMTDVVAAPELKIFDARPKLNAMANQLKGKGYERVGHYGGEQVTLEFLDIANIHVVRSSMTAVVRACTEENDDDMFAGIGNSNWMSHLSSILKGANAIVDALGKKTACIVHCSDGWDRTSQLSALAQLMLDPACRTIKGFCKLIQKEWCAAGHMFAKRCGLFGKEFEQGDSSPVFVQWLDAVNQIALQFPHALEFNEHLLLDLIEASYSEWYGTFLFNNDKERIDHLVPDTTVSFWDVILSNRQKYENILFTPPNPAFKDQDYPLIPNASIATMTFWRGLFRQSAFGVAQYTGGAREAALVQLVHSQQAYIQQLLTPQRRTHDRDVDSPPSAPFVSASMASAKR
eukprot:m.89663 g.89663  ORF g.89663 m.89663 type:complete len:1300 (-) comp26321_c0_seq2:99-3998(-)